jgi:hypothetical protein
MNHFECFWAYIKAEIYLKLSIIAKISKRLVKTGKKPVTVQTGPKTAKDQKISPVRSLKAPGYL